MSVPATGGVPTSGAGEEAIVLPGTADAAFAAIMDTLAPESAGEAAGEAAGARGGADAPAPAGGADAGSGGDEAAGLPTAGVDGVAGEPAGAGAAGDRAPAAGADGAEGAAAGDPQQPAAPAGADDRPAAWTADAASLIPKFGELSTALEENTAKAYRQAAFEEVREEHAQYFEALNKHPRLLVGAQVPAIGREGMETLRDTDDAREWQEATKSLLVQEINDRAGRQMEESADFLTNVHASIELFQNNADLVPGTKDFDVALANRFAEFAEPYELRVDGKLQGYSVPVQPLIDRIRKQLTAERAAAKTAAPAATPPAAGAAPAQKPAAAPAEPPQAGIASKAGNSSEKEDFSTLFGTIGLPNLQI